MNTIALFGAGGKMGVRLANNLKGTDYDVDHIEISEEGRQRLRNEVGVDAVDADNAIARADVAIMAVPDRMIGKVTASVIEKVKPGTAFVVLDAQDFEGAPLAEVDLPQRVPYGAHGNWMPRG